MRSHPARLHHARLHHHMSRSLHHSRPSKLLLLLLLRHHRRRASRQGQVAETWHEPGHHRIGHVVGDEVVGSALLLLNGLLLFLCFLVQGINAARVFAQHLDEEGHCVVSHTLSPSKLQADIRPDEIVASEQARSEALLHVIVNKVPQQTLRELGVAALEGGVHGVLVHLVLLRQVDGLLVPLVLLVHKSGYPSHLDELVLFQLLGQRDLVNVVKVLNRLPQILILLALDIQFVEGLVHSLDIVLLRGLQVGQDKRQMAGLANLLHHTGMIDFRHDGVEQCSELHGLFLQIERDGAVVDLHVRDLLQHHLELVVRERH
mmetsp:Transcript_57855/g.165941  ORF Transcript_57855/g.165941 Transcript_57855/m.165941 type:complete len:318 (-) Transcript_57855:3917-4870(-)